MSWYTPQELVGLPGLPGTEQNVRAFAKRHGWQGHRRLGSKAIEYPAAALPLETQVALMDLKSRAALAASAQALNDLADHHQALAEQLRSLGKVLGNGSPL
ncbi:MAG: hypothetical protein CME75_07860 [Halomonas sp.]|nr:hypothetical protein [Halomonas sp.]